jgi:hypothetical protein
MSKRNWILLGVVTVAVLFIARHSLSGHSVPSGQPQLLAITSGSLPQFEEEFNSSAKEQRVVLLISPTCPVCLEGSSAVEAVLRRHPRSNVRIFAVWEPMLPTDWGSPNTYVLARLSDPRVMQFWDKKHLIAGLVEKGAGGRSPGCCSRNGFWWDVIADYSPAAKWAGSAPVPELLGGTVIHTAPELETRLTKGS